MSKIQNHPQRAEIESALARGQPLRQIATQFGLGISPSALCRHRQKLAREHPEYFSTNSPIATPPDVARLLSALSAIAAAISRAAALLH